MKYFNKLEILEKFKQEDQLIVDISIEKITIILVSRNKNEIVIKNASIIRDIGDYFKDGAMIKPDKIVNEIHFSIKEMDTKCKNILISYGSSLLLTKIIKLVEMSDKDLIDFVELEYQRQFSMRSKLNYVMDYQTLGRYSTDKDINLMVLLASAPKNEIGVLLKELKLRKYKIKVVDIGINGIKNLMLNVKTKDSNKIILDLGKEQSTFIVIIGNVLVFIRDLNFGYDKLIKEIQKENKISYLEIEKLLENRGVYFNENEKSPDYIKKIEPVIREFLEGLFKSIEYVKSNFKVDINEIYISGEGTLIKGIDDLVSENLSVSCEKWLFKESDFDGDIKVINESDFVLEDDFIKSIGLSLRGLNK
jgi:type IV pilus assembly protein PilM